MSMESSFNKVIGQLKEMGDFILLNMINNEDPAKEDLNFSNHLHATKDWFIKISWSNKKQYILTLLEDMESAWGLSLILKSIWNCRTKDAVISTIQVKPWTVYDSVPLDHNRTATSAKTLAHVMANDRKWFGSLDPESQAMALLDLMTIAGGPIICEVFKRGQEIYSQYRTDQLQSLEACIDVDDMSKLLSKRTPKQNISQMSSLQKVRGLQQATTQTMKSQNNLSDSQKALKDVLLMWDSKLKAIRDKIKLEELEITLRDGTSQTVWKFNRINPELADTVDLIQMLPTSIAKHIMAYIPYKQAVEYTKVNKYWAYLIEEVKNEVAASAKLDTTLTKFKEIIAVNATSTVFHETVRPSFICVLPSTSQHIKYSVAYFGRKLASVQILPRKIAQHRPICNLAEVTNRLERRGAADEHLWMWCSSIVKQSAGDKLKADKGIEGVLELQDNFFPSPLMRMKVQVPLRKLLNIDPIYMPTPIPKELPTSKTESHLQTEPQKKRCNNIWIRDFASLYKAMKLASYDCPI